MLRFILRNRYRDAVSGVEGETFITVDGDLEELEGLLRRGGWGESGYDHTELVGVEVLDEEARDHE